MSFSPDWAPTFHQQVPTSIRNLWPLIEKLQPLIYDLRPLIINELYSWSMSCNLIRSFQTLSSNIWSITSNLQSMISNLLPTISDLQWPSSIDLWEALSFLSFYFWETWSFGYPITNHFMTVMKKIEFIVIKLWWVTYSLRIERSFLMSCC